MKTNFLKKYLGEDFESDLIKSDVGAILKPDANVAVLPQEIYISLQIVPRTVISLLVQHLKPLKPGMSTDIPWMSESGHDHNIHVDKISSDLYSGQITGEGKTFAKFSYRSLPAVGLVVMSTYELYDKETNKQDLQNPDINYDKVQKIIDERIRMQMLIEDVVNKKMSEKEAIQQLIVQKINDYLRSSETVKQNSFEPEQAEEPKADAPSESVEKDMEEATEVDSEETAEDIDLDQEVMQEVESDKKEKQGKLKKFLDKTKKAENVKIVKAKINCPHCSSEIFKNEGSIDLCLCFGEFMGDSIKIKKNKTNDYSFTYPKNFSMENATMLLDFLKKK